MVRAFIAFELPAALREELAALSASLKSALKGLPLSWVRPANMHLTLKFLGQIQRKQAAAVGEALASIASQHSAITVRLGALGAFPGMQPPRVIWVGLHAPAALAEIASQVEQAAVALGFAAEARPFTPHLTLARARRDAAHAQLAGVAQVLAAHAVPDSTSTLSELALFESQLKAGSAVYNSVVRSSLRAVKG
ncbi:MAG TPA: RNA 2',3'-cyclic phosphodiesterase [Anaerolineales bacterium]|mgnify:CR=1 FL=1|nr:RNA 2',3'-cyclic phosphodiesterase [Anaerolineales bacterium]HRQ91462.1 RNA 2',3'-cyclic phosphodiesterase [Anaerolineales bacterium]